MAPLGRFALQIACRAVDDTAIPLLAKGGTQTARLWTCVRDDRPFGGGAPSAALLHFSRDWEMAHPNRHLAGGSACSRPPLVVCKQTTAGQWMPMAATTTVMAAIVILDPC